MTPSRRREIVHLCLVAVVTALGMSLVSAAMGDSPLRATRGVTFVAVLLLIAPLMDLGGRRRDHSLLPIIAMICGIGLIILWRLDPVRASKQIVWMVMGAGLLLSTYLLVHDIRALARLKYVSAFGAVALLVATMVWGQAHSTPAQAHSGARLWLDLGFVSFQPTELAKILLCIFLAGYMADRGPIISEVGRDRWGLPLVELRYLGPIALMVAFCLVIFVSQRDLGAAVMFLGLAVALLYLGTGRRTYPLLGLIAFVGGAFVASLAFNHVHRRIIGWLNPWADPSDAGMQALQAMYGLGEGGLLGTGLGLGMPLKMPAVQTDLIFAAVGEELGLAGSCGLLLLFAMAVYCGFAIAWRCRDRFGMLLAAGLTTVMALQALVIVGGVIRVIPLTGITLPFVSYGGTSILVNFIAIGLLLCVSRDCGGPEPEDGPSHA